MDAELKKTIQYMPVQHTADQHAMVHNTPVQHAIEGYKSNQQLKCTRTQRDIKRATGPRIQYRSLTYRTLSDTVTSLEQKYESLQDRIIALEKNTQRSRDVLLDDDETGDTISDSGSCFEFINPENENENENDQTGQNHSGSRSCKDSSTSLNKKKGLSDMLEERRSKNDRKVTQIKARIAKLLGDIDDAVREMKETHEDIEAS
jgi:predicted RNase H-like nuclease (RuvC/YqgF family)